MLERTLGYGQTPVCEIAAGDTAQPGPDLAPDTNMGQAPEIRADLGPDMVALSTPDVAADGAADARDAADALVLRDTVAPMSSDGATVTIQDIMQACNIPPAEQTAIVACLTTMRTSWNKGVPATLAGLPCDTVASMLSCFQQDNRGAPPSTADFDATMAFRCPIPVYIGVRFV
jgi:hypothetical protein